MHTFSCFVTSLVYLYFFVSNGQLKLEVILNHEIKQAFL